MTKTLSEELAWRGFKNQTTLPNDQILDSQKLTFYWGVDPSSDSMSIGNLAIAMMVKHFIDHGHKAILLVGGATGLIGDPDGKKQERTLISLKQLETNKKAIAEQYKKLFNDQKFEIVDNHDWFKNINYLDFLRDIGKHVPLRQMLGRDFVQSRLGQEGTGISYAEFSYSLIQGYDFLHLYREKAVSLQLCGSDQWGNSIAGVELIRRIDGGEAHVYAAPLVLNKSTGEKFGKTEAGAVWLSEDKTSIFQFYQFWLNVDDNSVIDFLKIYTLLDQEQINKVDQDFSANKGARLAQKTLAYAVTKLVHGHDRAEAAQNASEVLFGQGDFLSLGSKEMDILKHELPVVVASADIFDVIVSTGLAKSKREARNFYNSGAISLNGHKLSGSEQPKLINGSNLLKRGKNTFAIIEK